MGAKDIVQGLFEKWESGDSTGFFAAVADEVVWTAIGHTPNSSGNCSALANHTASSQSSAHRFAPLTSQSAPATLPASLYLPNRPVRPPSCSRNTLPS
ncbi:MAG: hypothetical protein WAK20_19625 [Candidatus Acidiferrum sp.]